MQKGILLFILLCFPGLLWPRSRTVLKYGIVQTSFRQESSYRPGESQNINRRGFGVFREYFPKGNNYMYVSYGLAFVRKSVLLLHRTWPISWMEYNAFYVGDIKADVGFLEWPLAFGLQVPLFKDIIFSAFSGFSFSFPVKDYSEVMEKEIIYLSHEDPSRFDYNFSDELYLGPTFNMILGADINFKHVGFEFCYSRSLQTTSGFTGLVIEDYFDCWQFMLRFSF